MFKISKSNVSEDKMILYLLELDIEGDVVCKFGVTSRKIEDRVVEILTSLFYCTRRFHYCYPKRFKTVDNALSKEAMLLDYFKDYKYEKHKFSGYTELRDVSLEEAVRVYDYLLKEGKLPECG